MQDPNGRVILDFLGDPKLRPALVLSSNERINAGGPIVVVGISTKFDRAALEAGWFLMPTDVEGHPASGLDQPCVVKSEWLASIGLDEVVEVSKGVCGRHVRLVTNYLKQKRT